MTLIPDMEKTAGAYLRTHEDIVPLGTRFVGKTPGDVSTPWVQITELDARANDRSRADHLIEYLVQFDIYAGATGGQPEAKLHTRTIRAVLHAMPGVHGDTVVTSVRFSNQARVPDTGYEPARERVVLDALIHAHEAAS